MKRVLSLLVLVMVILSPIALAGESEADYSYPESYLTPPDGGVVILQNYKSSTFENLNRYYIDGVYGSETYTITVLGSIVNANIICGLIGSEAYSIERFPNVTDAFITLENMATPNDEEILLFSFSDAQGRSYSLSLTNTDKQTFIIEDTGMYSDITEEGHLLKATYKRDGYQFLVEIDPNDEVQRQPVNYLYLQFDGQEKILLTKSVDQGDYWTESIRNIFDPMMTVDGSRVYYTTDAYNRASGSAANNMMTRVVNLETQEDLLFDMGELVKVLSEYDFPFIDFVILGVYTRDDNGSVYKTNYLYSPDGELIVDLGEYFEDIDLVDQIITILQEMYPDSFNADEFYKELENMGKVWIDETIRGDKIEYSRYMAVVIEDYPNNGKNTFEDYIEFTNPMYPQGPYTTYEFSVYGTILNVKLKTRPSFDEEFRIYKIADKITDATVKVYTNFPTDYALDLISFACEDGTFYEIPFDDMSDEKTIVKAKYPF